MNNFKIAWRTIQKNKIYTGINIFGLTVGIAAALLIFRMVNFELSFNKNFENYDRIHRVVVERVKVEEGRNRYSLCAPPPATDVMENTVSQFEAMSRVREMWSNITIPNPNGGPPLKKFMPDNGESPLFVETEFFQIFNFEWLAGDKSTALDEPNAIVLNQTWAEKCFDNWEDAIGKTVLLDNLVPVTVKGVVADLPINCDFLLPYVVSFPTVVNNADMFFYSPHWGNCSSNDQVYALLQSADLVDEANAVLAKVGDEQYRNHDGERDRHHVLQPLSDLHFNEELGHSGSHRVSRDRLKVLSFIGILILIMACFNFINLATAQSMLRAKEVGVRKTLGGRRGQLVWQFMSETGLIVIIAVILGVNLALLGSPLLKYISDVPDQWPFLSNPLLWAFLAFMTVGITLLAGLYPSLTLASFQPVDALKSKITGKTFGGASLSKSLVVLQFVIAQGLIIGAIITILQLDYIRSKDLGFDQNLVYTFGFNNDSTSIARHNALRLELEQIPTAEKVSFSSDQPLSGNTWQSNFRFGSRPEDERFSISMKFTDTEYQETYGLHLVAGQWLTPSDTMQKAVVNMALIDQLGLENPEEALGQHISMGRRRLPIVGVVENFHTHSFRREHQPLMMSTRKEYYWEAGVKLRPDNLAESVAAINTAFDKIFPEQVFSGDFLDESIANFYEADNRLSATCKGFGLLAILISCLGLFGLATHAAAQRIKEIGIRKVLGASVSSIISLLSKDFLQMVSIALLIASPLAWWFMNNWLNDFVYRIPIQWWVFVVSGILALGIAFLTVSYQAVKAALANPVESLKSE